MMRPAPSLLRSSSSALRPRSRVAASSPRAVPGPRCLLPPLLLRQLSTSTSTDARRDRTAIFFPGQGTQKVGMLAALQRDFPATVQPLLDEADAVLSSAATRSPSSSSSATLSTLIASGPAESLTATENAQPAILLTSIAILRVLHTHFSFPPVSSAARYVLGHSLGEFTALVAGGYVPLAAALTLVRRRGEVMADAARRASVPELEGGPGETGMVALVVEAARVPSLIRSVEEFVASETLPNDEFLSIANVNSASQIVLSGHLKAVETCLCHIRKFGGHDPRALRLNVSAPFHSPVMAPAASVVRELLRGMEVAWPGADGGDAEGGGEAERGGEPQPAVVANVTARPYTSVNEIRALLPEQATRTVRWAESIQWLDKVQGVDRWIGIGPGRVGRNLVGREVRGGMGRVVGVEGFGGGRELEEAVRALEGLA